MPLSGLRVLLLRPEGQQAELLDALRARGADARHVALLEIQAPLNAAPLDDGLRNLASYDWMLFTSSNAVRSVLGRVKSLDVDLAPLRDGRVSVCAIGPATRRVLEAADIPVRLMPERYVAEGLLDAFAPLTMTGKRVLFPRAAVARDVALETLQDMGARVDLVEAYRTGLPAGVPATLTALCEEPWVPHWVLFTSASTVKNLLAAGGEALARQAYCLSIGPATSAALQMHGFSVALEAEDHSGDGVVQALEAEVHRYKPARDHEHPD